MVILVLQKEIFVKSCVNLKSFRNFVKMKKIKAKYSCKCASSGATINKGEYCWYKSGKVYRIPPEVENTEDVGISGDVERDIIIKNGYKWIGIILVCAK